jgi:hypothetical protein
LTQELAPLELTEEIVEGNKSVILFETSLRGQRAHREVLENARRPAWAAIGGSATAGAIAQNRSLCTPTSTGSAICADA